MIIIGIGYVLINAWTPSPICVLPTLLLYIPTYLVSNLPYTYSVCLFMCENKQKKKTTFAILNFYVRLYNLYHKFCPWKRRRWWLLKLLGVYETTKEITPRFSNGLSQLLRIFTAIFAVSCMPFSPVASAPTIKCRFVYPRQRIPITRWMIEIRLHVLRKKNVQSLLYFVQFAFLRWTVFWNSS